MQILINVPDEIYEKIKTMRILISRKRSGRLFEYILFNSIKAGIPLPKGHGRLIDADALGEELHRYTEAPYLYALKVFNDAPTIIEAESEDNEIIKSQKSDNQMQDPYKDFCEFVAKMVLRDDFEENAGANAELLCRKLSKLGIVKADEDEWILAESEGKECQESQ